MFAPSPWGLVQVEDINVFTMNCSEAIWKNQQSGLEASQQADSLKAERVQRWREDAARKEEWQEV